MTIERQQNAMSLALYNSLNILTHNLLNPQINVEEITENILIVLAIQNTILAQIRLTIYKSVMMSFDGYMACEILQTLLQTFCGSIKKI